MKPPYWLERLDEIQTERGWSDSDLCGVLLDVIDDIGATGQAIELIEEIARRQEEEENPIEGSEEVT